MMSIALSFGAPVIEPQGNSAAKTSSIVISGRVRAVMVEVICRTVG
jgi:hypothetical protein